MKLKISDMDLRDMLIYATRYVLGRSTYAVSTMAVIIKDNAQNISKSDLELFIREINEAIDMNMCGMEMDCRTWKHLAEWLQVELDKRNESNEN